MREHTDVGNCSNSSGHCPDQNKRSTVRAHLHGAHAACSSIKAVKAELERIKHILMNNGYTSAIACKEITIIQKNQHWK